MRNLHWWFLPRGENFSLSKMQKDRNTCGREMLQHGQTEGRIYFPYAGEYSNVELSAEDDGSDLTVDSDSAADMAASDDTVASEDTNLSIDATDSDVSTDEEGSSIAAANSDKENESDDFSSNDSQEVFSDGADGSRRPNIRSRFAKTIPTKRTR